MGGRDLLSTHVESRSYPTWDASIADGLPNQDGNEPWFRSTAGRDAGRILLLPVLDRIQCVTERLAE